jgi:hypothetical protein
MTFGNLKCIRICYFCIKVDFVVLMQELAMLMVVYH